MPETTAGFYFPFLPPTYPTSIASIKLHVFVLYLSYTNVSIASEVSNLRPDESTSLFQTIAPLFHVGYEEHYLWDIKKSELAYWVCGLPTYRREELGTALFYPLSMTRFVGRERKTADASGARLGSSLSTKVDICLDTWNTNAIASREDCHPLG